jgi:5'-3' exonuclease
MMKDIEREMGLTREDLVGLAYFLGSDYTEGIHGIGIVNAMEIVQAFFPPHDHDVDHDGKNKKKKNKNKRNVEGKEEDDEIAEEEEEEEETKQNNDQSIVVGDRCIAGLKKFRQWLEGYDLKQEILKQWAETTVVTTNKSKQEMIEKDTEKSLVEKRLVSSSIGYINSIYV